MARNTRSQQVYDHRLKELVQETEDIRLAVDAGVPSSTARGWLSSTRASVVTLDVFDAPKRELEREVLLLRRRNEILRAVLRVLVVALKVSGFSLANFRVPDGARKARFLRAVERSRDSLRLRSVLHLLRVSPARYYAWKRSEEQCDLDDHSSCPRSSPHRLTPEEISAIRELVTSPDHRHVPTGTLSVLSQRMGKVFASATTWYRLVRVRGWRRPRQRVHPEKPKVGIRASKPNAVWHIDTTVIRLLDGTRAYLQAVIDNFSRKILAWKVSDRLEPGNTASVLLEAARHVVPAEGPPTLITDGGVENFNSDVDALIDSGLLQRLLAMTEISYSNSLIESWWRALKHQWLYLNSLDTIATVRKLVSFYVAEHNTRLPHSAFKGQTPDEMYSGRGDHVPEELEEAWREARRARLKENRALSCAVCAL